MAKSKSAVPKKAGRPSSYTAPIGDLLCERIANGEALRTIVLDEGMPAESSVYRWLESDAKFREQYARAREQQADHYAAEILAISDDGSNDWMDTNKPDDPGYALNGEHVQRSRLRVDSRKWLASKLAPKKYGDKTDVAITGALSVAITSTDANVL